MIKEKLSTSAQRTMNNVDQWFDDHTEDVNFIFDRVLLIVNGQKVTGHKVTILKGQIVT